MDFSFFTNKKTIQYSVYTFLGFFAIVLSQTVSKDWEYYQFLYKITLKQEWSQLLSAFKEPLYFATTKLIAPLIGFSSLIAIITMGLLVFKLYFLNKLIEGPWWVGCFFYVCMYFFLFDATVLRVSYAVALVVAALYYLRHNKYLVSVALIFTASQLHLTALLFLMLYVFYFYRAINLIVVVVFIISPLLLFINFNFIDFLIYASSFFTEKYQFYIRTTIVESQNSTGLYYYFIAFFYIALLIFYAFLRKQLEIDRFKQAMFSISAVAVIFMSLLHKNVVVGARLGELLLICLVPILCWFYFWLHEKNLVFFKWFLVTLSLCYASARFVYLFPGLVFGF